MLKAQNVGIGTITPTGPLTVMANDTAKGITQKRGSVEVGFYTNSSNAFVQTWSAHDLNFATNNGVGKITLQNSSGFVGINTNLPTAQMDINGTLRIRNNGAATGAVLTSDASGNATWKAPSGTGIGFRGELGSDLAVTPAGGDYTVLGFTEVFDDGGGFNGSAGTFTAPSAGVYQFTINLNWRQQVSNTGSTYIIMRMNQSRNGVLHAFLEQTTDNNPNNTSYNFGQGVNTICKLQAGDVISVVRPQSSNNFYISGNGSTAARFSGAKLY